MRINVVLGISDMSLSSEQLQGYEKDGFLILKKFYSKDEIQQIEKWTAEIASKSEQPGKQMMYFEKSLKIGELRSGTYSPHFKKVIGIAMLNKPYFEVSQTFKISINDSVFEGKVCDLPFI